MYRKHTVLILGLNLFRVNRRWQSERSIELTLRSFSPVYRALTVARNSRTLDHQTLIFQIDLERIPINSRKIKNNQVFSRLLINISYRHPIRVFNLIALALARSPLRRIFEELIHTIL